MMRNFFQLRARVLIIVLMGATVAAGAPQYVIHISVDGLGSGYLQSLDSLGKVPNMHRLMTQGMGTLNARNDVDYTVTLPNHITMATGRAVLGLNSNGHGWTGNSDPAVGQTLQTNKGAYVASVFDVVHDNGLRTAMFATKTKFSLFRDSYSATNGANDLTGVNNGKNKIDTYVHDGSSVSLTSGYIAAMTTNPFHYSFVHYADPDGAGHSYSWGSSQYNQAVMDVDLQIGNLLSMIDTSATLKNRTVVILTADHGGNGTDHSVASDPLDYTIPFFAWGTGVAAGELYSFNTGVRLDPGTGRPTYAAAVQPVRNGDAANLATALLGLPAVPGSTINSGQNLVVPEPATLGAMAIALCILLRRRAHREHSL